MSHYSGAVPDTLTRATDWRGMAACVGQEPELFFPKGHDGPWALAVEEAKAVCRRCPVIGPCRERALADHEMHGVWGGLDERELRSIYSKRRLGATEDAPEETAAGPQLYATLRALFDTHTTRSSHGHVTWTGPDRVTIEGRTYTPRRLAFVGDRECEPVGRVLTTCSLSKCVRPEHIADDAERGVTAKKAAA